MAKKDLSNAALELIHKKQIDRHSNGLNPENHNTETKRYAKLSLSLTKTEKLKIEEYRAKHYGRMSISGMILSLLDEKGCFENSKEWIMKF